MTDAATRAQAEAADPAASTWLSANAGSGKTRVLIDRVARLLLAGADPQRILCLTYTKAAAAEMQTRLFGRLGQWAMLDATALTTALAELGPEDAAGAAPDRLAGARRLFARALETPGGLRIQTIHAFCAGLLRRFPLEAGVPPGFAEIDDRAARTLREETLDALASGPAAAAVAAVARLTGTDSLDDLAAELVAARASFARPLDLVGALARFGLPAAMTEADLVGAVLTPGSADLLDRVAALLASGSVADVKAAGRLSAAAATPDLRRLQVLEDLFLFGNKAQAPFAAKLDDFPTKASRARLGPLLGPLQDLMRRVEAGRQRRLCWEAARQTAALHGFAAAYLPAYEAAKAARGWLDFDDLITRARGLLTDPAVAQWVLFRLDGGIDHILVDEAQDTSPAQWQVISALAQEFTAGRGARDGARTIFVVGDRKQSIYSFQGADLEAFDRVRQDLAARLAASGPALAERALEHSFRSSPAILALVDAAFTGDTALGGPQRHLAFQPDLPGRVELWPAIAKADRPRAGVWTDPVDLVAADDPRVLLAARVAGRIADLIAGGEQVTVRGVVRPVQPGDVLILVQRRSDLFHHIIRACKAAGLPVAGADRMRLGGELAVRDLVALLSFLALPEDDLSLAATLRSPLFGWSEDALFRLAWRRPGHLWAALRATDDRPGGTLAVLRDLRDCADFLRPYELIERMLTRHGGRQRLLARLGDEAEDGIDALLAQALAYERAEVPSLTGFLGWVAADEVEVRRQMEQAGSRIRVMTVHGAKGLEAPIVILPETQDRAPRMPGAVLTPGDGAPVWQGPSAARPDRIAADVATLRDRAAAERLRLLYVALTRAQSWLMVGAAGPVTRPDCWYNIVADGMRRAGAAPDGAGGMRLAHGAWPAPLSPRVPDPAAAATLAPPPWLGCAPSTPPRSETALSPSDLGGAKALEGDNSPELEAAALRRGSLLHLLLEHLPQHPPGARGDLARALLTRAETPAAGAEAAMLAAQAEAILAHPDLAAAFAPGLVEVAVSGQVGGRLLRGSIDRLLVTPATVTVIDFKSNRRVSGRPEDVPEGILRQMGAYVALVEPLYPGREVRAAILWTEAPALMPLPRALVMAALQRAAFP
jgi:ATP-dependent helicase/nuclease subunit A